MWVPRGVAPGWAPYSTGRWVYDPYYGWTWVDDAPWGWAPYHYGRWVHVSGYWGWCPGPIVARPYYSPALVAFYGGGGFSRRRHVGTPYVGWVALGWGEPVIPWWGPARFRGQPYWAGWGGPRVVNNVVINNKTVIKGNQINVYQNAAVHDAIVGVDRKHFGRRSRERTELRPHAPRQARPPARRVRRAARSLEPGGGGPPAKRPPSEDRALRRRDTRAATCALPELEPSRDSKPRPQPGSARARARRSRAARRTWYRRRASGAHIGPRSVRPSARGAISSGRSEARAALREAGARAGGGSASGERARPSAGAAGRERAA